ncbi:MAG: 5'-nucleotidase C-terminal domain-containing protein [Muribaculaceae bacterium]|nr:5'-nucleotidase C-terminal domain-containing protein [Muribaculaceae bacterium]
MQETNIYAITDSHQESRNLSRLLSGIYNFEKDSDTPFLVLDAGDLFKGIYDRNLSVNAYIKLKQLIPNAQIFITLGNNDFGFTKSDFEYLKTTIEKFENAGIDVICANLHPSLTDKYKITEINGTKYLITGFCLNNSCAKKFNCELLPPEDSFKNLIDSVRDDYDKIIVLNHHWYTYSLNLKNFADKNNIHIDLIIGGHEHSPITPDYENNIFYPLSFARTMYKISIDENIKDISQIPVNEFEFIPELENPITEYETLTKLKEPIAKRVLNLTKKYSDPCPLGTFISDNMKKAGNTDIAFHSTGFSMSPLRLEDSNVITIYDLKKVICASTTIEKIEITAAELLKVFENATKFRMYKDRGNSRFLQCSQNITITGEQNPQEKTYKIIQISINGENLLDENQTPIDKNRKYSCTIDSFIGSGEQGFDVLKNIPKSKILKNNQEILINELFYDALKNAAENFDGNSQYPSFKFIDI